jgi:hypothetical protein
MKKVRLIGLDVHADRPPLQSRSTPCFVSEWLPQRYSHGPFTEETYADQPRKSLTSLDISRLSASACISNITPADADGIVPDSSAHSSACFNAGDDEGVQGH